MSAVYSVDVKAIREAGARKRAQRWVEMNCWKVLADFPAVLPPIEGTREQANDLWWKLAWSALSDSLTLAEQSLAWWLFELKRTPAEWRAWWIQELSRSAADADAAIAAIAPEGAA